MTQFNTDISYIDYNLGYQITMFAMWGIGVDIPRILMRYGKSYPATMNIHGISMVIITLLTIMHVIGWTVMYFKFNGSNSLSGILLTSVILSYVLVAGVTVQSILGLVVRAQMNRKFLSQSFLLVKTIHKVLGISLSVLGYYNVILGKIIVIINLLINTSTSIFRGSLFLLGALVVLFFAFEIIYRTQSKKLFLQFPLKNKCKFQSEIQQILTNLNGQQDNFNDYKQKGVRYIILDNSMYYIDEQFMHPGGQSVINIFNGREINYLFRGAHQFSSDLHRHRHTKYAMNYLNSRYVGDIKVAQLMITQKLPLEQIEWKIKEISKVNGNAHMISFVTGLGQVDDSLRVQQFGKYVMIACTSEEIIGKQSRPYTLLRCQSDRQKNRLLKLMKYYKLYMKNDELNNSQGIESNQNKMSFLIKSYLKGKFTNFLTNTKIQKSFKITGAYGRGLRLKSKSQGYFVMIGAGTGVLPYVDLFSYLLQKTIIQLIRDKVGDTIAQKANQDSVDYSSLEGVKILFIGSFQSAQHFYMSEVIKNLYHLNKTHKLDQFDMMLRYNNNESQPDIKMIKETFNLQFIKKIVNQNPNRIYYCGPNAIEQQFRKAETQLQWKGQFIYL